MAEMLRIQIDADSLGQYQKLWAQAPDIALQEMRRFIETAVAKLQGEVQERTPTNQGTLRKSIIGNVREVRGFGVEGVVGTPLNYAVAVELGTQPHMPPVWPLILWAQQKLGVRGDEAVSAAYAVARKIAREGTEGQFMFRDTFEANEAQIARGFTETVRSIARRIAGGEA
jgi:hypothetical protein